MSFYRLSAAPVTDTGELGINTINLVVGPQGCGKSYLMNKLIDKYRSLFDEVLFVAPSRTLTERKVYSPEDLAKWIEDWDQKFSQRKHDLTVLNRFAYSLQHPDRGLDLPKELPDVLSRYDKAADVERAPTALVVIDDFGGHPMFRSNNSAFSRAARQLRHMHITALISCHNIRDVSPALRSYAGNMYLFRNVPAYDLQEIWKNKGVGFATAREFTDHYLKATTPSRDNTHPALRLSFIH